MRNSQVPMSPLHEIERPSAQKAYMQIDMRGCNICLDL